MGKLQANYNVSKNNNISIKKRNLGGGKINLKPRTYLYKATGTGLTPNINGLRFYDSGLIQNGQPIFYDETNTYKIFYSGSNRIIALITSTTPNNNLFAKAAIGPSPIGIYNLAVNWVGTPTISAI